MKKKKQVIEFSEPELPFPIDENGDYQIPEECKAEVVKKMYPFVDYPKMDAKRYDNCEGAEFVVRDFIYHVKGELLKQYYSPLHESYKKSTLCGTEMIVTKADGVTKMRHLHLCRCKWCLRCQRIRSAELINTYSPIIATWDGLFMVTLTLKSVNPLELKDKLSDMQKRFRNIMRTIQRHLGKSDIKAIKTIEVTVNPISRKLHPHYHILTENAEVAHMMKKLWMTRSTKEGDKVVSKAQNVTRTSSPTKVAVEMFKYVTKFLGGSKADGKKSFDGWLLDKIYVGSYRKHLIQTFGFEKPKNASDSEEELDCQK